MTKPVLKTIPSMCTITPRDEEEVATEYKAFPKALWPGVKVCFGHACEEYLPNLVASSDLFGILIRADTKTNVVTISRTKKTGSDAFVECLPTIGVDIHKLLNVLGTWDYRMFKGPLQEFAEALNND